MTAQNPLGATADRVGDARSDKTGVGNPYGLRLVCMNLSSDIYKFANRLQVWIAWASVQGSG